MKRSVILQESSDKEKASGEFSHLEDDISEEVEESEENEESAENRESEEEFFSFDSNFGLMWLN